jgi:predicted MPP superfamily phosphohydrolase
MFMQDRLQRILRQGVYLVRGTAKAVQVGHLFPENSRREPAPAPGGTSERRLPGERGRGWEGELRHFMHATHRLEVPGLARELRLLHLTDVHVRDADPWLASLTDHLRGFRPDAVLMTGDLVTRHWTEAGARALLDALPPAPLGRFAVMGNWEHWAGADPASWRRLLAEHDVTLLLNEAVDLGPLALAGTDDLLAGEIDIPAALAALPPDKPAIALAHSPDTFPALLDAAPPSLRLVLSGHAHGGQVRLPRAGSFFVPRGTGPYVAGWFEERGVHLFVSRGIGWSLAPLRLGCTPEIAELVCSPPPASSAR